MTNHARLFKRALAERLQDDLQKTAFIPMTAKQGQQAGPGGMPVDPMAGGMGGAPMDPMAGGMPPMGGDPMAGGMPPMGGDPMGGGMPPMGGDPMAGGMPPMDPMAGMGGEMPPPPAPEGEMAAGGEADISMPDVDALKSVQQNTMEIVRQTLEMVGKAKPQEAAAEAAQGEQKQEETPPEAQPGPITGQPGFDPSMLGGPLNLPS